MNEILLSLTKSKLLLFNHDSIKTEISLNSFSYFQPHKETCALSFLAFDYLLKSYLYNFWWITSTNH